MITGTVAIAMMQTINNVIRASASENACVRIIFIPFFVDNINILCALNAKVKALLHFELKKTNKQMKKKAKKYLL